MTPEWCELEHMSFQLIVTRVNVSGRNFIDSSWDLLIIVYISEFRDSV